MKPKIVRIYSENNDFQYIETLRRNREKRHKNKEFFVEGVRHLNQAIKYEWKINAFLYSKEKALSDWARNILKNSGAKVHYELPLHLAKKLSNKEDHSELMAIVSMQRDDLSRIPVNSDMLVVIFDRPASPGNLGTLIRSCDALNVDGLIVTGHAADLYDPETISATTGSFFALPAVSLPSHRELLPWFEAVSRSIGDFQIVGSSAKADKEISTHDFTRPTVLIVGNETQGLSAGYKEMCHTIVKIPIHGSATSLNVACAASIILYEIDRQKKTVICNSLFS